MSHEVTLDGCTPVPLANYLKGLGVFRLIAEQADPSATAHWNGERLVLISRLSANGLVDFFRDEYAPTPIVAPWGGRSGFYAGSSEKAAREALAAISSSTEERLQLFREAITQTRELLNRFGFHEKPRDEDKLTLLRACRSNLPDRLIEWLDTCFILTSDSREFPPLLGTGGNEGSGSYVSGFAQQVVACVIEKSHEASLKASLFDQPMPRSGADVAPGHFLPHATGAPNGANGFLGGSQMNAWDYLLCLEGTLLFAAAATRRHNHSGTSDLSAPFTVRASGAGSGAAALADESKMRAEIWVPIWGHPASLSELKEVVNEGRATLRSRQAHSGLDFARAIAALGVNRGIDAFQRYGFMQRSGDNHIATPLNRIAAQCNPSASLIDQLEGHDFLDRFRRFARSKSATNATQALAHSLENALFSLSTSGSQAGSSQSAHIQTILERLHEVLLHLARSPRAREACPRLPELSTDWHFLGDDGSPEFLIAAALAGITSERDGGTPSMIHHIVPLEWPEVRRVRRFVEHSPHHLWGHSSLIRNVCTIIQHRLLRRSEVGQSEKPITGRPQVDTTAVATFLAGDTNDRRIARLLPGLALVRQPPSNLDTTSEPYGPLPAAYSILKPLFSPDWQLRRLGYLHDNDHLKLPSVISRLLAANRPNDAIDKALQHLHGAGQKVRIHNISAGAINGPRLLAALSVPVALNSLAPLLERTLSEPMIPDDADTL